MQLTLASRVSRLAVGGISRPFSTLNTTNRPQDLSFAENDDFSLRHILTPNQSKVLDDIKSLLNVVPQHLTSLGISKEDTALLTSASSSLDELFLVVVVGEFNAGKSNFINALLGAKHCKTGVLPTTETVQILRYGPQREETVSHDESKSVRTIKLPVEWLKRASLVDTPGTNAVLRSHQTITEKFVPSADLILFITSVERPFSESEKQFLSRISDWKKKVVIVLNKADLVIQDMEAAGIHQCNTNSISLSNNTGSSNESSAVGPSGIDLNAIDALAYADGTPETLTSFDQIVSFVRSNAKSVLSESPPVFGVSSRLALAGKMTMDEAQAVLNGEAPSNSSRKMSNASATAAIAQGRALIANSGFSDLERHVLEELTAENKVRLKMENPLSVAEHLLKKYSGIFDTHASAIVTDTQVRDLLRRELGEFSTEARNDISRDMAKLENVFLRMKAETTLFFTTQLRLGNIIPLLFNNESLRRNFDEKVNIGVATEVETIVSNVSNWVIAKTARQSQTIAAIMQRGTNSSTQTNAESKNVEVDAVSEFSLPIEPVVTAIANTPSSFNISAQAERVRNAGMDHQQNRQQGLQEMQKQVRGLVAEEPRFHDTALLVERMRNSAILMIGLEISAAACLAGAFIMPPAAFASALLAGAGLAVFPAQRARITREANAKTDVLFSNVRATLSLQFNREIEDASRMLEQVTAPYCKWVQHEEEKTLQIQQRFNTLRGSIHKIRKDLSLFTPMPVVAAPITPAPQATAANANVNNTQASTVVKDAVNKTEANKTKISM